MSLDELAKIARKYPPEVRALVTDDKGNFLVDWNEHLSLVTADDNHLSVDWTKYAELRKRKNPNLAEYALKMLIEMNILSPESREHFGLIGQGLVLNPALFPVGHAYFIKREDALKFKEAECSSTCYEVYLVQYLDCLD
ncbi:MAG: hypothetical protein AB1668_03325 [Nanoarchaeota archaeon]